MESINNYLGISKPRLSSKKTIVVLGANGQLGRCLQDRTSLLASSNYTIVFTTSAEVDITDEQQVKRIFEKYQPTYCINAAAYTAVDKAEQEKEKAFAVNESGAKNVAAYCKKFNTICIHISTDFVFKGNTCTPLTEEEVPAPVNTYGASKYAGEKAIQQIYSKHIILRTSWLFSEYRSNFLKTMNLLAREKKVTKVVSDQIGTPTYAGDLAELIFKIIETEKFSFGIYHFSNEGVASWYDFAYEVFKFHKTEKNLQPIPSTAYPTPAKRPHFTVFNKQKIKHQLPFSIPHWKENVTDVLEILSKAKT